jgi:hypothetical protein
MFKGGVTGKSSIKSAIKEQPLSQMHSRIMENYKNYKKIYDIQQ